MDSDSSEILVGLAAFPSIMFQSALLAEIPAVFVLLAECAALIPVMAYGFQYFVPSVDTPG